MISIIIPVYNEEKLIQSVIESVVGEKGVELIIVDGKSTDNTAVLARNYNIKLVNTEKNRGLQMNEGAKAAKGDIFLFLHADCLLDEGSLGAITNCITQGAVGGCLKQKIGADNIVYRWIESSGNIRAKLFKVFYGDQAIFVRRDIFFKIGGFDEVALFDDVLFSKKLRKEGKTCLLDKKVHTLARRWESQGLVKTTFINWLISLGFMLRISPRKLKKIYYDVR